MAAITESALWTNDIYRIEENDPVEGGEAGVDNRPHKDLANRTLWLKQQVETNNQAITAAQTAISNLTLSILNKVWPIGSVYENAVDGRNPAHADLLGFGTWVAYAEGKTSVGLLGGDDDFGAIGQTGGKKGHPMTLNNLIAHSHTMDDVIGASTQAGGGGGATPTRFIQDQQGTTNSTGQATPDPIPTLMPYIVSAKWRRTA